MKPHQRDQVVILGIAVAIWAGSAVAFWVAGVPVLQAVNLGLIVIICITIGLAIKGLERL